MNGLTEAEVIKSRKENGTNEINKKKGDSFFKLLINSLGDPIIKILLIALSVKTIFLFRDFDWYETIGIVISILIASFISSISEYGSEKAFQKLTDEVSRIKCRVKRNGKIKEIPINDVVVGDLLFLSSGDKIAADGIVVSGRISVDESSINGEAREIYKSPSLSLENITDKNKVYRGTVVYSDEAYVRVTNVGDKTFYGNLASMLQEKSPQTPLKLRLTNLARFISKIGYIGAFLVFISYLFKMIVINNNFDLVAIKQTITNFPVITGYILYALTLTVTIIIVAVPEGLPMMITLVLSSNMKRMLRNNVLVRKLVGIETSGNINILFTDKTGTLTNGALEVTNILDGEFKEYKTNNKSYEILKESCIGNNSSTFDGDNIVGGNITDRAILKFFNDKKIFKKDKTIPFDSTKKYSIAKIGKRNYVKGAPDILISTCTHYIDGSGKEHIINKTKLKNTINNYSKQGIRVLISCYNNNSNIEDISNLVLIGIILIKDNIRKDAKEGFELVSKAHIKTVMITGDNKDTAIAIAREVGIYKDGDIVLTSKELENLSDSQLKQIIPKLSIVSRSLPSDKSRLVRVCQELNLVVGMTGDGVNDAPALKHADVGFAMGSGTEVAKEASDIVILDNNFKSISNSILFGRTIFKSIRKFIILQLTINLCALSLSIIGPFINIDTPITVIQMLWINMVMDTLAGLAFSFEAPLKEYMYEYPKSKNVNIINKYMINEILVTGLYSSILCILFLKLPFIKSFFRNGQNNEYLYTAFFGLFIFIDIFNAFNARTHRLNLFSNILKNKVFLIIIFFIIITQILLIYYGGSLFRTSGLTFNEFIVMLMFAASVIPFDWVRKIYLKKINKNTGV